MVRKLCLLEDGKTYIIRRLTFYKNRKHHLIKYGLVIGTSFSVIRNDLTTVTIKVNNSKYILDFSLANRIWAEEIN